jgi:hypothetical protein
VANSVGVNDGWVDKHVREIKKRLIPLTMNNLLDVTDSLHALLNDIQTLIGAATHGEETSKHFQHPRTLRGGRGSTTAREGEVVR